MDYQAYFFYTLHPIGRIQNRFDYHPVGSNTLVYVIQPLGGFGGTDNARITIYGPAIFIKKYRSNPLS
jgi:hypothetical protein